MQGPIGNQDECVSGLPPLRRVYSCIPDLHAIFFRISVRCGFPNVREVGYLAQPLNPVRDFQLDRSLGK